MNPDSRRPLPLPHPHFTLVPVLADHRVLSCRNLSLLGNYRIEKHLHSSTNKVTFVKTCIKIIQVKQSLVWPAANDAKNVYNYF